MRSPIKTFGDDVAGPLGRRALSFSCVGPGDRAAILDLYAFIDWVMVLPKPFELEYLDEIEHFEQEKNMTYITSAERIGIEKGVLQGIQIEQEKRKKIGRAHV